MRIGEIVESQNLHGGLSSSSTVFICGDAIRDSIRELVSTRLELEASAHRRERVEISESRRAKLKSDLEFLTNQRLVDGVLLHPTVAHLGEGRRGFPFSGFIDDAKGPLIEEAREKVKALIQNLKRPEGGGRDTYIQNINAPNHGVIASRIEHISIGPTGESVKEALREILKASIELTEARQEEVRNLIAGLLKEVERGPDANAVAAATMTDRLKEALQTGANIAAVAQLFAPLADWIAKLATG